MTALEKQLSAISELFVEAQARAIRLVQCHADAQGTPESITQLRRCITAGDCPQLTQLLGQKPINGSTPSLHEHWIGESLSNAHAAFKNIQPRVVRAYRWRRKPTFDVFETYISTAQKNFTDTTSGVIRCINECFSKPSQYRTEGIEELAELSSVAQKLERRFKILASRLLSLVYSPRVLAVAFVVLMVSIPIGYYIEAARTTGSVNVVSLQREVSQKLDKQTSEIRAIVEKPERDFWTKADEISKKIKDIVGNAKTTIMGLLAIWGVVIKRLGR